MNEWKKITGFSNYEYSELTGKIRSINYKRTGKQIILKPAKTNDGYLKTMLKSDSGKYITVAIHRIIMNSKEPKPTDKHEVNHKNGIKTDNRPENLEWLTRSQNCKHSFDTGLQKPKMGELNGNSKLKDKDVEFILNEKNKNGRFWGRNKLAVQFGVTAKHLQDLANRK